MLRRCLGCLLLLLGLPRGLLRRSLRLSRALRLPRALRLCRRLRRRSSLHLNRSLRLRRYLHCRRRLRCRRWRFTRTLGLRLRLIERRHLLRIRRLLLGRLLSLLRSLLLSQLLRFQSRGGRLLGSNGSRLLLGRSHLVVGRWRGRWRGRGRGRGHPSDAHQDPLELVRLFVELFEGTDDLVTPAHGHRLDLRGRLAAALFLQQIHLFRQLALRLEQLRELLLQARSNGAHVFGNGFLVDPYLHRQARRRHLGLPGNLLDERVLVGVAHSQLVIVV